ncbi:uncharacterized protein [Rutidosis leptorrhynchoides]|uniref:uncharacterized protein n=1 Tax=Rutidosis leptorrhynchoides TaxID=125765 RepID=UPI003A994F51
MGNMVAMDMSYSTLEIFEPPTVLRSLLILNLRNSHNLLEIRNIFNIPHLETLILWNCNKLVHVCETIGDLTRLALLNMTGCYKLWKGDMTNLSVGLNASTSRQDVTIPKFSFPHSLNRLFLKGCYIECTDSFPLSFNAQPYLQYLNMSNSLFVFLPCYSHLKNLRVLDLSLCSRLKWLLNLPGTLAELYVYYCKSLERKTFESHQFTLLEIGYEGCINLYEIEGFIKLLPIAELDESALGHLKWLKVYENHTMCLVGDVLAIGSSHKIQMLYEFDIMSTSLPFIKDPNLRPDYESDSASLSFDVPACPKNMKLEGVIVTFKYTLSGDDWAWFAKISTTNNFDVMYNPKIFGKPEFGDIGIWLSYWPIGNSLGAGDKVNVGIAAMRGFQVHEFGVSLVYTDDEISKGTIENNTGWTDNLGEDFSRFQLNTGAYYLCRRDFFELMEVGRLTPDWFMILVGDTVDSTEVRGWRKTGVNPSFTELKTVRCIVDGPELDEVYNIDGISKSSHGNKTVQVTSSALFDRIGSVHLTMNQVARASQYFRPSLRLGEGGFGTIYKGQLPDGQVVAIERAKKEHFDALRSEFKSEVELLKKIDHVNLVKLLGYVDEGNERLIIAEYVPNGTLREHLDGVHGSFLDFSQRLEICIDIAHGLTYLHLYAEKQIIHRDVKSSNILLTERLRAKVPDFGFARLGDAETDKGQIAQKIRGTVGYLDPEYMRTYQLTPKSDVYSFVVLLIEILTGRRPIESKRSPEEKVTIRWVTSSALFDRIGSVHLTMNQVARATQYFRPSLRLGEGGFGTIYKGQLPDGQVVAIERAKKEHFDALRSEFKSEVELLKKIDHVNLVKLLGYVDEGNEQLIITEYVPNGTLREHLDGVHGSFLDFSQRLEICIDIAHGLTYLHLYAEKQIIHRDVKSSNILLTERLRAKVADFGFARLGDAETDKGQIAQKVKGTVGYLDPEYMRTYQLTPKSDVYSFGVLLIEILTGRRPIESKRSPEEKVTIRWAFGKYKDGDIMDLVDPQMKEAVDSEIFTKMLALAFQCAAPNRVDRPDMKTVGEQLWAIRRDYLRQGG